jgi:hypothetical protein
MLKINIIMKKPFFFMLMLISGLLIADKVPVRLFVSAPEVDINGQKYTGRPSTVALMSNGRSQEVELYNDNGLIIKANYDISTHDGVKRSNLKKSSVDVEANYTFYYNGEKRKVKTKRIFYLTDDKKFDEEQTAYFKKGINNIPVKIKYTCMLE